MWSKIAVVHVMDSADIGAHLKETLHRVEQRLQIIGVPHCSVNLVAQAIVKRETWLYFPVVLGIESHAVLCDMAMSIPEAAIRKISLPQQQLLNIVLQILAIAVIPRRDAIGRISTEIADRQTSPSFVPNAIGIGALEVSPQFDGVISIHPR